MKAGISETEKYHLVDIWIAIKNNDITLINLLIEKRVDVNAFGFNLYCPEEFPLLFAIRLGRIEIAQALIQAGASIENQYIGSNPLHYAISYEQTEIALALLAAGANSEILYEEMTALHHSIHLGLTEVAIKLIEVGANTDALFDNMTVLHHAIKENSLEIVRALIPAKRANIEAIYLGMTPLHYAIRNNRAAIAIHLIENHANIEALYEGTTPFDRAILTGQLYIRQALVNRGADTNGFKQDWTYKTDEHYKCWFSLNRNDFLDVENQLRLIKLISQNPQIKLTFIYSSKCLSQNAIEELSVFCKANNIIPLDFDTQIKEMLVDNNDITLYALAEEEIDRSLRNEGGNIAGASDIIRLILPIIEKCGMYNDFEKQLNIDQLKPVMQCSAPIMINSNCSTNSINNDAIAVAIEQHDNSKLATVAIDMIKNAQSLLIANYKDYAKAIRSSGYINKCCELTKAFINGYIDKYPNANIFGFRKFIQNANIVDLMDLLSDCNYKKYVGISRDNSYSEFQMKAYFGMAYLKRKRQNLKHSSIDEFVSKAEEQINYIKNKMLKISVIAISGPEVMNGFYHNRHIKYFRHCGIEDNIKNLFIKESLEYNYDLNRTVGYDVSWTPSGAAKKIKSSNKIKSDIILIQRACRKFNARDCS